VLKANRNTRDLRSALLLGAATAAALGMVSSAAAQEAGGNVETVVVTGSRIPQAGLYAASPVTAVGQQELKFEGTTNVINLINNLPQVVADQTSTMSNGATGTANIDLRGLGASRTLVLINGSRLQPGDPIVPEPDVNDIPAALVDHVEVLTGGASAVYGSDAEAGVVNFIMRKDFEGVELDGQYDIYNADNNNQGYRAIVDQSGFPQSEKGVWNGGTSTGTLLFGADSPNGKGNVTGYIGYQNTQPVLEGSRDFSACTNKFSDQTPQAVFECGGSSNYDRVISWNNEFMSAGPSSGDYFIQGTGKAGTGQFVGFGSLPGSQTHFNYGAINYLQRPDTRYTGGFFAHYQENKQLDLYSNFMFTDDLSRAQVAQSGLFLASGTVSGSFYNVNCSNPYLSAQENQQLCGLLPGDMLVTQGGRTFWDGGGNGYCAAFGLPCQNGQSLTWIGRRNVEGDPRISQLRHTSYRMQVGARGDLGDGWTYDIYAQYGYTIFVDDELGYVSIQKIGEALQAVPGPNGTIVCADGNPNCTPIDVFSGIGGLTHAMETGIATSAIQDGFTEEQIVSGSLTGDLGAWGGKSPWAKNPIGISFGGEWRAEYLNFNPDAAVASGDLSGFGGAAPPVPTSGFNVTEGFTEVQVPLVEGMNWVESLSLNGGYRYSSYNLAGNVTSYKYGAEWQPIDDIRLRASYQRAVRAPNVLELFGPTTIGLFGGNDPCASQSISGVVAHNCETAGGFPLAQVPANDIGSPLLACVAGQCNRQTGGVATVKPEKSDTRSIGFVFTPTFFDGFTATVDYFDIRIANFLGPINPNAVLASCYGPSATAASQAVACADIHRDASHTIVSQQGYVVDLVTNQGSDQTKGWDFETNYTVSSENLGLPGWGGLNINFFGSWEQKLTVFPITGFEGSYNCAGLYGYTCGSPTPKWRHKLRFTWTSPWDFDLSLQWRYLSGVFLDSNTSNPLLNGACGGTSTSPAPCPDIKDNHISSFNYFDISGNWTISPGVSARAGINNMFDKEPPFIFSGIAGPSQFGNGNTFPGTYDALGRQFFVGLTVKY